MGECQPEAHVKRFAGLSFIALICNKLRAMDVAVEFIMKKSMYTLYFADKVTVFATEKQNDASETLYLTQGQRLTRERLLTQLAHCDKITVVSSECEEVFADFCSQFFWVEAAGGVVENSAGQWLLIYRNGRWDLPKGHLESGESLPQCAAREVSEECGLNLSDLKVGDFICMTLHFYFFNRTDRWDMKRTAWYKMSCETASEPVPQSEEGITRVEWMTPSAAREASAESFRTISDVISKTK